MQYSPGEIPLIHKSRPIYRIKKVDGAAFTFLSSCGEVGDGIAQHAKEREHKR